MTTVLRGERAASMTSSSSDAVTSNAPRSPVKTLQQLLNEVEQLKVDVQTARPTTANDGKDLRARLSNLQRQINTIRNDANPPQPSAEFDQSKQRALEALSGLFKQLDGLDQKRPQPTQASSLLTSSDDDDSESDSQTSPPVKPRSPREGSSSNVQRPVYEAAAKSVRKASTTSESEEDDQGVMYARTGRDLLFGDAWFAGWSPLLEARGSPQIRKDKESSGSSESEDGSIEDQDQPTHGDNRQEVRTSTPIRRKPGQDVHRRGKDAEASTINADSSSSDGSRYGRSRPAKEKLSRARSTGKHSRHRNPADASTHDYDRAPSPEVEESSDSAGELDKGVYTPGTRFRATHSFQATRPNDLNFKVNDILILREQRPNRWWLCEHEQTGEQGSVPINHITLHRTAAASSRLSAPASIIANAWRTTRSIPSGFFASELASLSQLPEHRVYRTLIPRMSESNLAFADLHWRYETEDIRPLVAEHQILLTIKECLKIPRVDINQVGIPFQDDQSCSFTRLMVEFSSTFSIGASACVCTMVIRSFRTFIAVELFDRSG